MPTWHLPGHCELELLLPYHSPDISLLYLGPLITQFEQATMSLLLM